MRFHDQEKGLDGIVHDVFTDIADWPRTENDPAPHNEQEERKKITVLDLANHNLQSFNFTLYPELETLDISNNNFPNLVGLLNLTANSKLKYLDVSNCGIRLRLNHYVIKFGDNKKTLEEFHFVNAIKRSNIKDGFLDLTEFTNLKKISYSWESWEIWLNKNLEGKVTRIYPTWEELDEDEKLCYTQNRPQTNYDEVMKNMVIYK